MPLGQIEFVTGFGEASELALIVEMIAYQFADEENILADFTLVGGRYQMQFQPGPGASGYDVIVKFPVGMSAEDAYNFAAEIIQHLHAYRGIDGATTLDFTAAAPTHIVITKTQ